MTEKEPAFATAGKREGFELWRIEALKPVKQPDVTGVFHVGDSYILLVTTKKNNKLNWNIHFWLGNESSDDEKGIAAYKSVELDDKFGGAATQYREVQGAESALFLSYFKDTGGIEYAPGGVAAGFRKVERDVYEPRLLHCKGARTVRVSPVPITNKSLNKGDVFILDLGLKLYIFNGPGSNLAERKKANEVASRIDNDERGGRAEVYQIDDHKDYATAFWDALGGYIDPSTLPEGEPDSTVPIEKVTPKIFKIGDGNKLENITPSDNKLKKDLLHTDYIFLIHTSKVYIWIGKKANATIKRESMATAVKYLKENGLPDSTAIERISEGVETAAFRSEFFKWEVIVNIPRGIAATQPDLPLDVKAILAAKQIEETPFDDGSGKLEIWVVENFDLTPVDKSKYGQFYGGDSYIVLYTYQKNRRDEYMLYFWLGNQSSKDEQGTAALKATEMDNKYGGRPVQVRVVQGKEPAHFRQLFKGKLIVHAGGKAAGFKNLNDKDSMDTDGTALFRVHGSNALNTVATQVPEVAASLNSQDTFVLITPTTATLWKGRGANAEEIVTGLNIAKILANDSFGKGGRKVVEIAEGSETAEFWNAIGGKGAYPALPPGDIVPRDPRLFQCSNAVGSFGVTELHDFTQADLNDEDVFLLDTYTAVYLWIGSGSNETERTKSAEFAKQYVEVAEDGRDKGCPIITIKAGSEPAIFTSYFIPWESTTKFVDPEETKRLSMHGAPTENVPQYAKVPLKKVEPKVESITTYVPPTAPSVSLKHTDKAPADLPPPTAPTTTAAAAAAAAISPRDESVAVPPGSKKFTWDQIVNGVDGIDKAHKEDYLDDATFRTNMGVDRAYFNSWPKWKRDDLKKKKGIF